MQVRAGTEKRQQIFCDRHIFFTFFRTQKEFEQKMGNSPSFPTLTLIATNWSKENTQKIVLICSFWLRQSKIPLEKVEKNLFLIISNYHPWLEPVIFNKFDETRWEVSQNGRYLKGIKDPYWCTCPSDKGWNTGKHKCDCFEKSISFSHFCLSIEKKRFFDGGLAEKKMFFFDYFKGL